MSEQLEPVFREPTGPDPIEAALLKMLGAGDPAVKRNPVVDRMMATIVATTDCPYCGRPTGELCVAMGNGIDRTYVHAERGQAWKRNQ